MNIKKILLISFAIIVVITTVAVVASASVVLFEDDGYTVPTGNTIHKNLTSKAEDNVIELLPVSFGEKLYKTALGWFKGDEHIGVDKTYPLLTNNGKVLKVMKDTGWMINSRLEPVENFEGMYIGDGTAYNRDKSQADLDEFILLSLDNKLFVNTEAAVYTNRFESKVIPINSIVNFTNKGLSWYAPSDGCLFYDYCDSVFDAYITFGSNKYRYSEFLDALGLLDKAEADYEQKKIEEADRIIDTVQRDLVDLSDEAEMTPVIDDSEPEEPSEHVKNDNNDADRWYLPDGADNDRRGIERESRDTEDDFLYTKLKKSQVVYPADYWLVDFDGDDSDEPLIEPGDKESKGKQSGYKAPVVSLLDFEAWTHAIGMTIEIDDPYSNLKNGVRITAYGDIEGLRIPDEYGTYPADENTGKDTQSTIKVRGDQSFALGPVPPNSDVYIQFAYKYSARSQDETGIITKSFTSDFYKIHTPAVTGDNFYPISAGWTEEFAEYEDDFMVTDIRLANTQPYTQEPPYVSFENYKRNSLRQLYAIEYTLTNTADPSDVVKATVKKTTVDDAIKGKRPSFSSETASLRPNSRYSYTTALLDRYGNSLPMVISSESRPSMILYTRKQTPDAEMKEGTVNAGSTTFKVILRDGNHALNRNRPLALTAYEGSRSSQIMARFEGTITITSGGVTETKTIDSSMLSEDGSILYLPEPEDNKEYEITITSFAYAVTYTVYVEGEYDPQPDFPDAPGTLRPLYEELGMLRIFTAPVPRLVLDYDTSCEDLTDYTAALTYGMRDASPLDQSYLTDIYAVTLTERETGKSVKKFELKKTDPKLQKTVKDSVVDGRLIISGQPGMDIVEIVGDFKPLENMTVWDAIRLCVKGYDTEGQPEFFDPLKICIRLTSESLRSNTNYRAELRANIYKSGHEYGVTINNGVIDFCTKKTEPVVRIREIFLSQDTAVLSGVRCIDVDDTVDQGGEIKVSLYRNDLSMEVPVSVKTIYAMKEDIESAWETLEYEDIILPDTEYTLVFRASVYRPTQDPNDTEYNYEIERKTFASGSRISGSIELKELNYDSALSAEKSFISLTAEQVQQAFNEGKWTKGSSGYPVTSYYELPSGAKFISVKDAVTGQQLIDLRAIFKDSSNKTYSAAAYTEQGVDNVFKVPTNAVMVQFYLPSYDAVISDGFEAVYFSGQGIDKNLFSAAAVEEAKKDDPERYAKTEYKEKYCISGGKPTASSSYDLLHMYPVQSGEVYTCSYMNNSYAWSIQTWVFWSSTGNYIGSISPYLNCKITVPDGAGYVSVYISRSYMKNVSLCRVQQARTDSGYTAKYRVSVVDNGNLIRKERPDGTFYAEAKLVISESDTINNPTFVPYGTDVIELAFDEATGSWYVDSVESRTLLEPSKKWRIGLYVEYNMDHKEYLLDTLYFQTDNAYALIHNQRELLSLNRNPYGNYLVVEDFDHEINTPVSSFYGTIDFQGHKVTRRLSPSVSKPLIQTVAKGAVVKNLIYEYDFSEAAGETRNTTPVFTSNYGTISSFILKTKGDIVTAYPNSTCPIMVNINYGLISDFVVELDGDLILQNKTKEYYDNDGAALMLYSRYGVTENGYIWAHEGHGLVFKKVDLEYTNNYGLVYRFESGSVFRNIYMVYDCWFSDKEKTSLYNASSLISVNTQSGLAEDVYLVGDYYLLNDNEKSQLAITNDERMHTAGNNSKYQNLWHITDNNYPKKYSNCVSTGQYTKLRDTSWQNSILGSAFDVDDCVNSGYYPRLSSFDPYMEKYQPYIPFKDTSVESIPVILSDEWATGEHEYHDEYSGNIRLRMRNDRAYEIQSVSIAGLDTEVLSGKAADDGLYDVILGVKVADYDPETNTVGFNAEFLSSYRITGFVYGSGAGKEEVLSEPYETKNIEFWRPIKTHDDWFRIDQSSKTMKWNYRLMTSLNFSDYDDARYDLDKKISGLKVTSTDTFYGKIDGNGYALTNIRLQKQNFPCLIYTLGSGAMIRNLYIDGFSMSAAITSAGSIYTGFIGRMETGSMVDGLHISNASYDSYSYVGAVTGYQNSGSTIQNSSVSDTVIDDLYDAHSLYAGGMVGYNNSGDILCSFVRNIRMDLTDSLNIVCAGGIAGFIYRYVRVEDCYATGVIRTTGSFVGGIIGKTDAYLESMSNCWSLVNIEADGSYVGGISGKCPGGSQTGCLAMGDVIAMGDNRNRISGNRTALPDRTANANNCAYLNQAVSGLEQQSPGDASALFNGTQLRMRAAWADKMEYGSQWDLTPVVDGFCPKILKNDGSGEAVGGRLQEDIPLPGSTEGDPSMIITYQDYDPATGLYVVTAKVVHPGYSTDEMSDMYDKDELQLELEGFDTSSVRKESGEAVISWRYVQGEGAASTIHMVLAASTKKCAFSQYKLRLSYTNKLKETVALVALAEFKNAPNYWEISNIEEWNQMMHDHGANRENFNITGEIDFSREDFSKGDGTNFRNLKLGKIVGVPKEGGGVPGFYHLTYTAGASGGPWIDAVGALENLVFEDVAVDLCSQVISVNQANSLILAVGSMDNCSFRSVSVTTDEITAPNSGLIYKTDSDVNNIDIDGFYYLRGGSSTAVKSNVGAFIVNLGTKFVGFKAKNVNIEAPNCDYVAMIRNMTNSAGTSNLSYGYANGTAETVTLDGRDKTGRSVRYIDTAGGLHTVPVSGFRVNGRNNVAGLADNTYSLNNIYADSIEITAGANAGGIYRQAWSTGYPNSYNLKIINSTILSDSSAGAIAYWKGGTHSRYIYVVGCKVGMKNESKAKSGAGTYYGGAFGNSQWYYETFGVTVRDTTVTGYGYVGGYTGSLYKANSVYVAEDVSVKAIYGYAGGIAGRMSHSYAQDYITNFACGADVTGEYAGGIYGYSKYIDGYVTNGYVSSTVTGSKAAAPVIADYTGLNKDGELSYMTADDLKGILFTGTLIAETGAKVSLFANCTNHGDTPHDCEIKIWDNASVCGVSAKEYAGGHSTAVAGSTTWLAAGDFRSQGVYNGSNYIFDRDGALSSYMPFIAYPAGTILNYCSIDPEGKSVGILLPAGGRNPNEAVAYSTGAGLLNIESKSFDPNVDVDVTVGGTTTKIRPDKNGVITINYDYKQDVSAGAGSWHAAALKRDVLTVNGYYYFIDESGDVRYGTGEETAGSDGRIDVSKLPVLNLFGAKAVHLHRYSEVISDKKLWYAEVLDEDGNIHRFDGQRRLSTLHIGTVGSQAEVTPIMSYYTGSGLDYTIVSVYHNFTELNRMFKGTVSNVDARIYSLDGVLYTESPALSLVYDGISIKNKGDGAYYLALLTGDGGLRSGWSVRGFTKNSIKSISNSIGYSGNILLAKYSDGVVGVDFVNKKLLFDTRSTSSAFSTFASSALQKIVGPLVNGGNQDIGSGIGNLNPGDMSAGIMLMSAQSLGADGTDTAAANASDHSDPVSVDYETGGDPDTMAEADAVYVDNDGVYVGDEKIADVSEVRFVRGEGLYFGDELVMFESMDYQEEEEDVSEAGDDSMAAAAASQDGTDTSGIETETSGETGSDIGTGSAYGSHSGTEGGGSGIVNTDNTGGSIRNGSIGEAGKNTGSGASSRRTALVTREKHDRQVMTAMGITDDVVTVYDPVRDEYVGVPAAGLLSGDFTSVASAAASYANTENSNETGTESVRELFEKKRNSAQGETDDSGSGAPGEEADSSQGELKVVRSILYRLDSNERNGILLIIICTISGLAILAFIRGVLLRKKESEDKTEV